MRSALMLGLLIPLVACAETVNGPRLVDYHANRFYIRYVPLRQSDASIERLAETRCAEVKRVPQLESSTQYLWLDVRDDMFRCVAAPAGDAAPQTG